VTHTPVWYARVDQTGRIHADRQHDFLRHVLRFAGQPVEVIVRKIRKHRSNKQNAFYWSVVVGLLAEHCGYTPEEMHEALKWKFLRTEVDSPLPTVRSTTSLSTVEFEEYQEQIRIWASSDLGVYIPLPNEVEAA
jgi:hypothetical protein